MTTPHERPLPVTIHLPPSISREIGRACTYHALIEWLLNRITYQLLGVSDLCGRIAVREPRITDRIDMIIDLMKIREIEVPEINLNELRGILGECSTKRDALAHGIWVKDPKTKQLFLRLSGGTWSPPGTRGKVKRRIDLEAHEFDAHEASLWTAHIEATMKTIKTLHDRIKARLSELPRACTHKRESQVRFRG
jgi:hypothetical protein